MYDLRRYTDIHNEEEIKDLKEGMDFREPKYRREVFLRFYGFHLKYGTHPGLVYLLFPWFAKKYSWTQEQKYWFAFLNGCTQNPLTTWAIFSNFPVFEEIDLEEFETWHQKYWRLMDFDIDRRYQKGHLSEMVQDYFKNLNGMTQTQFFEEHLWADTPEKHFRNVWDQVKNHFFMYGRLSSFSYIEYLKIMGLPIEFDSFFMEELSGSKSQRNGCLKVLGRDDLQWHEQTNPSITTHSKEIIEWVKESAWELLGEAKERFKNEPFLKDVGPQTLESTFCCYKSWHRHDRRYPNVYTDMFYNRIISAESKGWPDVSFQDFRDARKEILPKYLRVEDNPKDMGLVPIKQNWYRRTGEVIMMDEDFPEFKNGYRNKIMEGGMFDSQFLSPELKEDYYRSVNKKGINK